MRTINVILAVLVSLTIALLVFEGGLRLIGFAPKKSINRFDPVLGWSKEPGARVHKRSGEYEAELVINQLGLRDDPMSSPAKTPGTFRVLCLGDSFTLGYTVPRQDLFVDQLERRWRAEGRAIDVINAGTEGYSTDQEVRWLMEHGAAYQPDLVLLFPYENDIYWNGETSYFRFPKPRFRPDGTLESHTLADPGRGGWSERLALANFVSTTFGARPSAQSFHPEGGSKAILKEWAPLLVSPPGFVTEAVARTEGALRALKGKCDELGAALVVVPIPSKSAVHPELRAGFGERVLGLPESAWSPDLPVDTFLELCKRQGIATLDARPALRERARAGEALYFVADWHLNATGNEAFGTFLHDELDQKQLAGFPAAATRVGAPPPHPPAERPPLRWPYVFAGLWVLLSLMYSLTYRDEPRWRPPLAVGGLLALVFTIVLGGRWLIGLLPPIVSRLALVVFVAAILTFVVYKLGRRVGTIAELLLSFTKRGHWYLMPLVVVLLTIGSLLVVAASSPLVAPFIYTLF